MDFLLGMEWKEESSRVVRRLVQTHSHLPQVWIYAARFELEMKVINDRRRIAIKIPHLESNKLSYV